MTDSDDEVRNVNNINLTFGTVRKPINERVKKIMLIQWIDDISSKFTFGDYILNEGVNGKICKGVRIETGKHVLVKVCKKKKAVFDEIKIA